MKKKEGARGREPKQGATVVHDTRIRWNHRMDVKFMGGESKRRSRKKKRRETEHEGGKPKTVGGRNRFNKGGEERTAMTGVGKNPASVRKKIGKGKERAIKYECNYRTQRSWPSVMTENRARMQDHLTLPRCCRRMGGTSEIASRRVGGIAWERISGELGD